MRVLLPVISMGNTERKYMRPEIDHYKFAEKWAKQWMRKHKYDEYADEWDAFGMRSDNPFDVNLYVEDNVLSITAYPLVRDYNGHHVIDTDKMFHVYVCPWNPKSKK